MRQRSRPALAWALLVILLIAGVYFSLWAPSREFARAELQEAVFRLRLYRVGCSVLAGSALAMAGVLVQGLFRNPLASPSILGTSSGASLGGMLVLFASHQLVAGGWMDAAWVEMGVPLGCCVGAALSLLVLLFGLGLGPGTNALLLGGVILSSLLASLGALVMSFAQAFPELGRAMMSLSLGGVQGVGLRHLMLALPLVLGAAIMARSWARSLDLLLTGEQEATSLGLALKPMRRWVVVWVAVLSAAAVAIGGNLMFVGLVVPHMLRPFVGVLHRQLLAASALGGAVYVLLCDALTRLMPAGQELPLGVVTSLCGAPVFLLILVRESRRRA